MRELKQIEAKFGITLPKMYRKLAEKRRLDRHSETHYELADGLWVTPQELAKFEWDDTRSPVAGLVPFATNGAGDYFCWHLPTAGLDGEPAVMECPHDSYEGRWFASSMAGAVFRHTLECYSQMVPEEIVEGIGDVIQGLRYYAPKDWVDVLRKLKQLAEAEDEDALDEFADPDAMDKLIRKCFGRKYVDKAFIWDELGLPLTKRKSKAAKNTATAATALKNDKELEKHLKSGAQLLKKIKKYEAEARVVRSAPVDQAAIDAIEKKLKKSVPSPLKSIMAGGEVLFGWDMDSYEDDFPEAYEDLASGTFFCDPKRLLQVEGDKQKFLKKASGNAKNKQIWANTFAFEYAYNIGGASSFIALEELKPGVCGKVLVLECKGAKSIAGCHELSTDFETFLQEWSSLAFVETKLKTLSMLTTGFSKPLSSKTPLAKKWLKWLVG